MDDALSRATVEVLPQGSWGIDKCASCWGPARHSVCIGDKTAHACSLERCIQVVAQRLDESLDESPP